MSNSRFAGELLVAAELTRLGFFVSLNNSFGVNTPKFDLHASNAEGKSVTVQVKALKAHNSFIIDPEKIEPRVIYVFVVVGDAGTMPAFWIISGRQLLKVEKELFGKWGRSYPKKHGRGFQSKKIPDTWRNAWSNLGLGNPAIQRAHLDEIRRRRLAVRSGKVDLVDGPIGLRQARAALRK